MQVYKNITWWLIEDAWCIYIRASLNYAIIGSDGLSPARRQVIILTYVDYGQLDPQQNNSTKCESNY